MATVLTTSSPSAAPEVRAAAPTDVIVHLFEWPWASVASECQDVLGPKGFAAVQVSPPQEHVVVPGFPWWQDYQPVSYQLNSRRGDRAAFASMVQTCHAAGVKIYVDAVVNHMAGGTSTGPGSGGSTFSQYGYPAVPYGDGDFHHCGRNGNDDIVNWGDRWEVQNCELVDLSDLKTESQYVRDKLAGYLNDLLSLGVDGFRVDAAKHVPAADLQALYGMLNGNPYVYQEVIEGGPGEISPTEYTGIGDVTEFRYGEQVSAAFRDGNLPRAASVADSMLLGSDDAIAFIDNHDTQRNGKPVLTYKDGATYALAEAFMLAWPCGHAQVMSSFSFSGSDQGPPADASGQTNAGVVRQRLGVRAPLAHDREPGRLPQRGVGHGGHELLDQRRRPARVRPRGQGFRGVQPVRRRRCRRRSRRACRRAPTATSRRATRARRARRCRWARTAASPRRSARTACWPCTPALAPSDCPQAHATHRCSRRCAPVAWKSGAPGGVVHNRPVHPQISVERPELSAAAVRLVIGGRRPLSP